MTKSYVEPNLLYAAPIWVVFADETLQQKVARRLTSNAIVITKAFCTSSTEAVLVLANLLLADLRAKELAASHSLKTSC